MTMTKPEFISSLLSNYRADAEDYATQVELIKDFLDRHVKDHELKSLLTQVCYNCEYVPRVNELSDVYYEFVKTPEQQNQPAAFDLSMIAKLKALRTKFKKLDMANRPVPYQEWIFFSSNEWLLDKYETIHGYECTVKALAPEDIQGVFKPWNTERSIKDQGR